MAIEFTQYILPNGRKELIKIDRGPAYDKKASALRKAKCRFEAEILRTGEVSLTCEQEESDGNWLTLSIEVVPNGPGILEAVDRLIDNALKKLKKVANG